ncbi:hypothetical protein F0562_019308 [Nyssa sinensis]|uniref:Copper ion binding protein n=1 Tax=Nyssa sinensis TaxID=561372 RepID=A0A5J4ZDV6_9ASTE|nr:hypothetical protein F0562_019308 [Nyssa sinensis]
MLWKMMRITNLIRLKPLSSSVESSTSQFLQQRFVSKTAKGKGKTKAGLPLKRSKITTKRGTGTAVEEPSPKGGHGRTNELTQMIDNCLNASAPVRFLKPKEKEREAEREKMGLISKARKTEIEKLKKKKSEKVGPTIIGTPGLDFITLGLVDADAIPKYELTVEDGRRLAKEYSRVLMRRHRARQAAESALLRSKKEAIEALPEHLKAAALVPDLTPFPANRFMATLTPPIEGYIEKIKEAAKKSAGKEKLR